jgi:hypothetical protein
METFKKYIPYIGLVIALIGLYLNWKQYQDQRKHLGGCKCQDDEGGSLSNLSPIR